MRSVVLSGAHCPRVVPNGHRLFWAHGPCWSHIHDLPPVGSKGYSLWPTMVPGIWLSAIVSPGYSSFCGWYLTAPVGVGLDVAMVVRGKVGS